MIPFLALGGGTASIAYLINRRNKQAVVAETQKAETAKTAPADEPISAALKMDDLKIEFGYALLPLVNSPDGTDRLTEQIKALRRSLAIEMGFVMPAVRILDNMQLEANSYVIKIKEVSRRPARRRSSRSRRNGSRHSQNRSSARAMIGNSPGSRRNSPNSSIWCGRNSRKRRATARRRCW